MDTYPAFVNSQESTFFNPYGRANSGKLDKDSCEISRFPCSDNGQKCLPRLDLKTVLDSSCRAIASKTLGFLRFLSTDTPKPRADGMTSMPNPAKNPEI